MFKPINPQNQPIISLGRMTYEERTRSFSLLRIKQKLREFLPQLKNEKRVYYQLEYHWSYAKTLERVAKAQTEQRTIPLLLFIYGDTNEHRDTTEGITDSQ